MGGREGGVRELGAEDDHMSVSLPPSEETVAWQPVTHSNISHHMKTYEEEPTAAGLQPRQ